MIGVRSSSSSIRLRPVLARLVRGSLMLWLVLPVRLAGQETGQVTLYTPDGSQQYPLSAPQVMDMGLPSPMEAPRSAVISTGAGTRLTGVEVMVSDSAGGQLAPGYADGWIRDLAADGSGNVWVATSAGLSRFDGQQWTTFTEVDGYDPIYIYSVTVDGQGQVWVGSLPRVTRFDGQRWTRYRIEGLAVSETNFGEVVGQVVVGSEVEVAPNGDVWCGGFVGGFVDTSLEGYGDILLARFDGQTWWTYNYADLGIIESEEHFDAVQVTRMAFDQSGTLWANFQFWDIHDPYKGTNDTWLRVLSFDGTQWTSYRFDPEGHLEGRLYPDREGRVWVECPKGFCVKDGSAWKHYATYVPDWANHYRMYADGTHVGVLEGTIWTGFYWKAALGASVTDSRGDLWTPSSDGLYRWSHPALPTAIESSLPTAIASSSMSGAPHSFHLAQNYPNPFNHATHIGFTLQQPSAVSLQVFNTHGQLVATLVEGIRSAGTYQAAWDGRDAHDQAVSSGVYIVRLDAEGRQATRKMLLIQ